MLVLVLPGSTSLMMVNVFFFQHQQIQVAVDDTECVVDGSLSSPEKEGEKRQSAVKSKHVLGLAIQVRLVLHHKTYVNLQLYQIPL